ncbi:Teichoic acids export ATP-binding protein TagH [Symmachiella dynata]|uniref:Teichoic acids export ATP-binding protein TagH n=1 Tax=Symmachiella dynata TaxID=2527995 RepID=A0A517ZLL0_9PLAN|nr:ABC transporter ATP-binding protein [Symmachiella dynata]QDU43323.1 Teichoic acids export ATP-binding protein TagH [Symmachiella dynata]
MIHLKDVGVRCGRTAHRDRNFNRLLKRTAGRLRNVFAKQPVEIASSMTSEFWSLRDVSFDIGQGESVGIVGTNGAGKSTLLRVVGGIYRPTTGQVTVNGKITPLLALQHGFNSELTGMENLRMAGILLGLEPEQLEELIPSIIEFTELGNFIDKPVRTYSSGMLARLGFAVSTAVVPDVLILDEVMGVGDGAFRERCKERLVTLIDEARILLLCSHNMNYLKERCERVIWMNRGQVELDGPVDTVLERYQEFLSLKGNRAAATTKLKQAG